MPEHPVLNKIYPREKLFNQSLIDLRKGEYPIPAHSSHPVPSKRWEGETEKHLWRSTLALPTPHHHITEGLFTAVPFTWLSRKFTRPTKRQNSIQRSRATIKTRHSRDVEMIEAGIENNDDCYAKGSNEYSRQHARTGGQCKQRWQS